MDIPQMPNPENFTSISRNIWQEMREGIPYDQGQPDHGDFTNDCYGKKEGEGINFNTLVRVIKKNDHTQLFDWNQYVTEPTPNLAIDNVSLAPISKNVPFTYTNKEGKKVQAQLSGVLNKRKDYLEYNIDQQWAFNINILPEKEIFDLELNFFYQDTFKFRQYGNSSFESNSKYVAICLQSASLLDFLELVRFVLDDKDTRSSKAVESSIARTYANAIIAATDGFELNFLYGNAPEFVLSSLSQYIDKDSFFTHLLQLKARDESKWFKDTSGAIINVLKSIGDAKFIYQKFIANPVLLKEFFFNLDGESPIESQMMPNKLVFASFMAGLCRYNGFKGFEMGNLPRFTIGNGYYVISEIDPDDDPYPSCYLLKQQGTVVGGFTANNSPFDFGPPVSMPIDKPIDLAPSGNYEPFEPVLFVDATAKDKTPMLVPAIYVKALSHLQQVKELQQNIRIGADILGIVLGIVSLGAASPLLAILGGLDIALTTADLVVAFKEDELMKTQDGQDFLKKWNEIALIGGIATAGPLLVRSTFSLGAKLISQVTLAGTRNFLMACLTKMVLEMNIARFAKNTLKVVDIKDIFLSFPYLTYAKQLFEAGLIFVEGELTTGKRAFGALYKGELIAVGTKENLVKTFDKIWKLRAAEKLISALDNMLYPVGKVAYGESRLGLVAIEKRIELIDPLHNGNVAVFEFINKQGAIEKKAFTTLTEEELLALNRNDKPHAEQLAFEWLAQYGITNEKVLSIYSELEPCMLARYECKAAIAGRFPQAKVSYSFAYTDVATRRAAIKIREKILPNFIKKQK
jgi:hypothetical protein